MPDPTVYLETTIPSYLAPRPSRDLVTAAHQGLTWQWWEQERGKYRLFVSPRVWEEAQEGDPDAARRRMDMLAEVAMLEPSSAVDALASEILKRLRIPDKALADAFHLAYAVDYEIDYLLTWNCAHLANGPNLKALATYTHEEGLWLPIVCTPEALTPRREGDIDVP